MMAREEEGEEELGGWGEGREVDVANDGKEQAPEEGEVWKVVVHFYILLL